MATEMGAQYDLAEAYYQRGLTYQAVNQPNEGNICFERAIQIFEQIRAPKQVERVQAALENEVVLTSKVAPTQDVALILANQEIKIFFSYSHQDEHLRSQLAKHLSALQQNGKIIGWHDRQIGAGQEWQGEIHHHLETSHIILLLVSSDFIASKYCYDIEVKRAMERHDAGEARVIPIILRPVDWEDIHLGRLQALPKGGVPVTSWQNQDEAFLDISKGIRIVVDEISLKYGHEDAKAFTPQ